MSPRAGEDGLRRLQGTEPGWDHRAEKGLSRRLLTQAENAAVHSVAQMVQRRQETVLALVTHCEPHTLRPLPPSLPPFQP